MKMEQERTRIIEISQELIKVGLFHSGQGNISVYNREQGLIAITPSAVPYEDRTPEDVCIVDLEGNLISGKWKPTSEINLHLIFFNRREDINAVVHTHAPKSTVFGIIGNESMPMVLNEAAMCIGRPVPVAPYARPGTKELAEVSFEGMGEGVAVIMAHHGLTTVGSTLERAFMTSLAVESTAAAIITARSMGKEPLELDPDEVSVLWGMFLGYGPKDS